jgi:hypothetical protein
MSSNESSSVSRLIKDVRRLADQLANQNELTFELVDRIDKLQKNVADGNQESREGVAGIKSDIEAVKKLVVECLTNCNPQVPKRQRETDGKANDQQPTHQERVGHPRGASDSFSGEEDMPNAMAANAKTPRHLRTLRDAPDVQEPRGWALPRQALARDQGLTSGDLRKQ